MPEKIVKIYATPAVAASKRPAFLPTSAMPGAINPRISRGIIKLNKLENILLKVANTLDSHSGKKKPQTTPSMMAAIICASSGSFFIFIMVADCINVYCIRKDSLSGSVFKIAGL